MPMLLLILHRQIWVKQIIEGEKVAGCSKKNFRCTCTPVHVNPFFPGGLNFGGDREMQYFKHSYLSVNCIYLSVFRIELELSQFEFDLIEK